MCVVRSFGSELPARNTYHMLTVHHRSLALVSLLHLMVPVVWIAMTNYKQWSFELLLKNSNRPFLAAGCDRGSTSIIPWPGCLVYSFARLRGRLLGLLARCCQVHSESYYTVFRIVEWFWELAVLEYPTPLLLKLGRSLPKSSEAQVVKKVLLGWLGPSIRFATRPRVASSLSCSSDSSEIYANQKMERAKPVLLRHDSEYQSFVEHKSASDQKQRIIKLGRLLAQAFKEILEWALAGQLASSLLVKGAS